MKIAHYIQFRENHIHIEPLVFIFHHEMHTRKLPCLICDSKMYALKMLTPWSNILNMEYAAINNEAYLSVIKTDPCPLGA